MSEEKISELEKFHRSLHDKRQADRVKAVIALSKGWSSAQVAEILLFDEKTSRHYFERYQQGGLQALLDDNYSGAEAKLDEHQMSELEGYLEEHILPDAKSVIVHIDKQYRVHYSVSGVTDLLHRLGFSYKKQNCPTLFDGKHASLDCTVIALGQVSTLRILYLLIDLTEYIQLFLLFNLC